jgi:hypothetical protein
MRAPSSVLLPWWEEEEEEGEHSPSPQSSPARGEEDPGIGYSKGHFINLLFQRKDTRVG